MMSGFHGLFSLGGIVGAAGVSALLGAGRLAARRDAGGRCAAGRARHAPRPICCPTAASSERPAFAVPHGIVLFIGVLCFIVFLAEGAVLDWSAVFLTVGTRHRRADAGLGYAAFALTMTVGRLTGDRIVRRVGGAGVIVFGGI